MRARGLCQLLCGEPGVTTVCSYRICQKHVAHLRAIAHDAGVTVDEGMLSGSLRRLRKRRLTRAEERLGDQLERREMAAARTQEARR